MGDSPRIVAELGRPETPDETAARKAASSRAYRGSQNVRNLIAALIATIGVLLVIILIVPRGEPAPRADIDVAAVADGVTDSQGSTALAPDVPSDWTVNSAAVEAGDVAAWTIVYVPGSEKGYLRVAQGFDADEAWPARVLKGAAVDGSLTVDGIEWDRYDIPDPQRAGNVSTAIGTAAGSDTILIYGTTDEDAIEKAAASVADQIRSIRQEDQ